MTIIDLFILGEPVYKRGTAASDCPAGYTDNDGLCSKNQKRRFNRRKNNRKNKRKNKNKKYI